MDTQFFYTETLVLYRFDQTVIWVITAIYLVGFVIVSSNYKLGLWIEGNEPMISVYSNRIEILSRGTLAPSQTMDGFLRGESVPVNEKLSEIFLQLHISEKSGRGVRELHREFIPDVVHTNNFDTIVSRLFFI